jgi:hypothetical protein
MIIIAIDPGKSGAIAISDNGVPSFIKMPENRYEVIDYFQELIKNDRCIAVVEQLHAGSQVQGFKKGVKQIWSQAANYENILCALYAADIKCIEVSPQKWMSKISGVRPKEYKQRKSWLHEQAKKLYPELKSPKYAADALCLLHVSRKFI